MEEAKDLGINQYDAYFRNLDPQIGRWFQIDPKPDHRWSPYAAMNNNPINFSDFLGDSSVIDKYGYIIHYDSKDKDLRVFMQNGKELKLLGDLGGCVDASEWLKNLLEINSKEADDIWIPQTFKNYVKKNGRWDYKKFK